MKSKKKRYNYQRRHYLRKLNPKEDGVFQCSICRGFEGWVNKEKSYAFCNNCRLIHPEKRIMQFIKVL
jgi:hypothetical protein